MFRLQIRQYMEENRRRHVQKVFAFALVIGFRLPQVILDHSASRSVGVADDNVAKPDVATIVRSGDTAPNSH
jgi:hypothetical protein